MAKTIVLKYAGRCADCGAELEKGTRARWYGRGRVYGLECHEKPEGATRGGLKRTRHGELVDSAGHIGWAETGADGREYAQNYNGRCEDAPCCGCCT